MREIKKLWVVRKKTIFKIVPLKRLVDGGRDIYNSAAKILYFNQTWLQFLLYTNLQFLFEISR